MKKVLVLRPEPGASRTIAAAQAMGLETIRAPSFTIEPTSWTFPDGAFDALMLTSANAVRWAGGKWAALRALPAYAVGEATAAVARDAGLDVVHVGVGGAAALVAAMRAKGVRRALHLAGEGHRAVENPGIGIERVIVYRSAPIETPAAPAEDAVALIHSPNAGCLFAQRIDKAGTSRSRIAIAAISAAAADAVGGGWAAVAVAAQPTDAALLAIAAKLCEEGLEDFCGRA